MEKIYYFIHKIKAQNKLLCVGFVLLLIMILSFIIFIDDRNEIQKVEKEAYEKLLILTQQYGMSINVSILTPVETTTNAMKASLLSRFNRGEIDNPTYIKHGYEPSNFQFAMKLLDILPFGQGLSIWFHPELFKENVEYIPNLYVAKPMTKTIVRMLKYYRIEDIMKEEWFYKPFENKKAYWSNPFEWENQHIFTYSIPVYMNNKNFAVIATDIYLSVLEEQLSKINFLYSGYAYMLDNNLKLIIHPHEKSMLGKNFFNIVTNITTTKEDMLNNETGFLEYDFKENKIATWFRLQNGYYMILVVDKNEVLANVKKETMNSIIIGIMFIIISIGIVYILTLSRPLILVEKTITKSLGKKNVSVSVHVSKNYEAGKISIAINNLFTTLSHVFRTNNKLCERKKTVLFKNISQELSANLQEILASVVQITDKSNMLSSSILKINNHIKDLIKNYIKLSSITEDNKHNLKYIFSNITDSLANLKELKEDIQKNERQLTIQDVDLILLKIIQYIKNIESSTTIIDNICDIVSTNIKQYNHMKNINSITEASEEDSLVIREVSNNIQFAIDSVVKEIEDLALRAYELEEDIQ